MGRYLVRVAEEYYDMDSGRCDARGYPIKEIRYTGEEYETSVDPGGDFVEYGPDGYEIHTVIGGGRQKTTYEQTSYDKNVELRGEFLCKKDRRSTLIKCPNKYIQVAMIPNWVKEIERFAFDGCFGLITVIIPSSVEKISPEAFIGSHGLRENYNDVTIEFANDVKTIRSGLIPSNTSKLGNRDTREHLVKKIVVPDSVTKIEGNAFQKMDLRSITLPDSIEEMGKGIFSETSIDEVYMSESSWMRFKDVMLEGCERIFEVKSGTKLLYFNGNNSVCSLIYSIKYDCSEIGDDTFRYSEMMKSEKLMESLSRDSYEYREKTVKSWSELKIPTSIQSIGERAFMECTVLVKVELPETLTYLGDEAFKDCINLEEITIPKGLTCIGKNTFEGCSNLKRILLSRKLYEESKWKFPETTEFLFYDD